MYKYVIPENFKISGCKYVVYGFGNVGKDFCDQLYQDETIKLVGVVDKKNILPTMCNTYKPEDISKIEFDYILVAVENAKIYKEIQLYLISQNIGEEKILWDGDNYANKNYFIDYNFYAKAFIKDNIQASRKSRRFFLFMLPEHGNIGDYAIGYAEKDFFDTYFDDVDKYYITTMQWKYLKDSICDLVNDRDIIFFNGGGYFGNLRGDNLVYEDIYYSFPNNIKIFFPNNFTYKNGISENNVDLMNDIRNIVMSADTHVFFRGKTSFEFAKKYSANVRYYPDMAFRLMSEETVTNNKDVLLCLRDDEEKVFSRASELKSILQENNIVYDEFDIHRNCYISQEDGRKALEIVIKKFQEYKLVITDRLHGMILSVVGRVPVIAFDNSTHKISDVFKWVEKVDTVFMLDEGKMGIVPDIFDSVSRLKTDYEISFKEEFYDMSEYIKKIVSGR